MEESSTSLKREDYKDPGSENRHRHRSNVHHHRHQYRARERNWERERSRWDAEFSRRGNNNNGGGHGHHSPTRDETHPAGESSSEAGYHSSGAQSAGSFRDVAKSDIATVCSGSVQEDIDVASVTSGDATLPAPIGTDLLRLSMASGYAEWGCKSDMATVCSGSVPGSVQEDIESASVHSVEPPRKSESLPAVNDMGPPVCRITAGSYNGSDRVPSDVVAHVDTEEDQRSSLAGMEIPPILSTETPSTPTPAPATLCNLKQEVNGRVSPGGTVYKGRGVRRYQGRYMHLPLKRFQQNGVMSMENASSVGVHFEHQRDHFQGGRQLDRDDSNNYREQGRWRQRSRTRQWSRSRSRSNTPPPSGRRKYSRGRSRSRSLSPRKEEGRGRNDSLSPNKNDTNNAHRNLKRGQD